MRGVVVEENTIREGVRPDKELEKPCANEERPGVEPTILCGKPH